MQDCLYSCRKCVLHVILGNERFCSLYPTLSLVSLLNEASFYLILCLHTAIDITRRLLKPVASFIGRLSTLLACTYTWFSLSGRTSRVYPPYFTFHILVIYGSISTIARISSWIWPGTCVWRLRLCCIQHLWDNETIGSTTWCWSRHCRQCRNRTHFFLGVAQGILSSNIDVYHDLTRLI